MYTDELTLTYIMITQSTQLLSLLKKLEGGKSYREPFNLLEATGGPLLDSLA